MSRKIHMEIDNPTGYPEVHALCRYDYRMSNSRMTRDPTKVNCSRCNRFLGGEGQ